MNTGKNINQLAVYVSLSCWAGREGALQWTQTDVHGSDVHLQDDKSKNKHYWWVLIGCLSEYDQSDAASSPCRFPVKRSVNHHLLLLQHLASNLDPHSWGTGDVLQHGGPEPVAGRPRNNLMGERNLLNMRHNSKSIYTVWPFWASPRITWVRSWNLPGNSLTSVILFPKSSAYLALFMSPVASVVGS